jgi:hypothetical protein
MSTSKTTHVIGLTALILSACALALVASQEARPSGTSTASDATTSTGTTTATIDKIAAATATAESTGAQEASTTTQPSTTGDSAEPAETVTKVLEDTIGETRLHGTVLEGNPDKDNEDTTPASKTDENEPLNGDSDAAAGFLGRSISHAHSEAGSENSVKDAESPSHPGEGESSSKLSAIDGGDEAAETNDAQTRPKPAASAYPRHINLTQVDQIYVHGVKDEQESVERWHKMGKKLKKGIGSLIGQIMPHALNMSQEAKISSNCSGGILKWVLSMNQLKGWALRMLDASGKPIAGLLEGSMTMFGNHRQCLKVRAPDDDEIEFAGEFREYFRGKYCVIQAKPWLPEKERFYNLNTKLKSLMGESENEWYDRTIFEELNEWLLAFNFVNIRYDLCVPSVCSREDIQKAINYLLNGIDLKARVLRCETERPDDAGGLGVAALVESSSAELADALMAASTVGPSSADARRHIDLAAFSQLGWILIPLLAVVLVLIATALSLTIDDEDADTPETNADKTTTSAAHRLKHTIKSFSLKRSVGSHLSVDYDQLADDKPLALYGLRFLLVLWVILVESAVNLKFEYLREMMMLKDLLFWWPMQFIINSTMQYDSFILLTAFTMGYKNCLNDGVNNVKAITRYVVDKYVRLMPSIMVLVAVVILMPLAYRGPVWNDYVTKQSAVCQSTGWLNAIFLQNYLPYDQIVSTQ